MPAPPARAKGVGESPNVGSPPAIVNAVIDALHETHGVDHIDMPCTPARVWAAMQGRPEPPHDAGAVNEVTGEAAGEIRRLVPDIETLAVVSPTSTTSSTRALATSMFLSLRLPQPLLLEGEAGVGKTEAAKALALVLDTPWSACSATRASTRRRHCTSGTTPASC